MGAPPPGRRGPAVRGGAVTSPARLALRRLRARWLVFVALTGAIAGAGLLLGWSSVAAALSQEDNVRFGLADVAPDARSLQVVYRLEQGESDTFAPTARAFFTALGDVTEPPRVVRLWHSVGDVRLVTTGDLARDVVVRGGRRPNGCNGRVCEALALAGDFEIGDTVPLKGKVAARIVGLGSLSSAALPEGSEALSRTPSLTGEALLVQSFDGPLASLVRFTGASVVMTAPLRPAAVHGFEVRGLARRIAVAQERVGRQGEFVDTTTPLALLDRIADRGDVARERLLLVTGQAAALIIAFAAFAAATRRRDIGLAQEQLETLGASRAQIGVVRVIEAVVPCLAGTLLALTGLFVGARLAGSRRDLPSGFVDVAVTSETVAAICALGACAFALLLVSALPARPSRFGVGPLEIGALAALGVVVWQATTTAALDPARIEGGEDAGPVLLLLPALAFFAVGVLLLRAFPFFLRAGERVTRGAPIALRLAFLTAARSPAQAAAATTFLAIALGTSLFALNYRATLDDQAQDQARFAVGAAWRVSEAAPIDVPVLSGRASQAADTRASTAADIPPVSDRGDVTPLTRFGRVSPETPTPVLRFTARLRETGSSDEEQRVEVVALPADRIASLLGWREGFSSRSRTEIARLLRPRAVRLHGPSLASDARALRFWVRADTELDRFVVLHFLLPAEQRFVHLRAGILAKDWQRLRIRLPSRLRGAELTAVEFPPLLVPFGAPPDEGMVRFGRFEERRAAGWTALPRFDRWTATPAGGEVNAYDFRDGPVQSPVELSLEGTAVPLVHVPSPVPTELPALVSGPVAGVSVDRRVTIDARGTPLPLRVAATARLFPTVTETPREFVVVDYDTLFAALNLDQPGVAAPSEALFLRRQAPGFAARLNDPPFRAARAVGAEQLEARLLSDPLAGGARRVLGITALVAAALALLGLLLAARTILSSERSVLAEYEALGVPPSTLARSMQLRLLLLSAFGTAAGVAGGLLAVRLIGAFVAVTGTAGRPLPPIEPTFAWAAGGVVVLAVWIVASLVAVLLAGRAFREVAATRLRA